VRNARLVLVLLPLITGFLLNRFAAVQAGWPPLLAWVFLVLWMGFGLWVSRSSASRALALAAGLGVPVLFLLLYRATVGTWLSLYPQLYFLPVVPAAVQLRNLAAAPVHATVGEILPAAALLMAAAFLAGFLLGWRRSRERRQLCTSS